MPWFRYQAKDRDGVLHEDRLETADPRHVHRLLTAKSWFVIKVEEESGRAPKKPAALRGGGFSLAFSSGPKRKLVPVKTEQMAQLLRAGMRLSEVLATMGKRSADPSWRAVFEDLRSAVVGGKPLSEALAIHPRLFTSFFRAMVATGEASGHLVEVLERLSQYLQRREALQQQLIGALIYPAVIMSTGVMTVSFFMLVMLPRLAGMFKEMGQALPLPTQILIWTSESLARYGWVIPLVGVAGWMLFRAWMRDPEHRVNWDRSKLGWLLVGNLIALGEYSRFAQTLATLLQSGITLVDALQVAEATFTNTALKGAVRSVRTQVQEGRSLHESLTLQGLFPDLMLDMLVVGERTGDLSGALAYISQTYERELERAIRTFTSLIEPALIIFMAAFVGAIVLSVLLAVFDLTSGIGRM